MKKKRFFTIFFQILKHLHKLGAHYFLSHSPDDTDLSLSLSLSLSCLPSSLSPSLSFWARGIILMLCSSIYQFISTFYITFVYLMYIPACAPPIFSLSEQIVLFYVFPFFPCFGILNSFFRVMACVD